MVQFYVLYILLQYNIFFLNLDFQLLWRIKLFGKVASHVVTLAPWPPCLFPTREAWFLYSIYPTLPTAIWVWGPGLTLPKESEDWRKVSLSGWPTPIHLPSLYFTLSQGRDPGRQEPRCLAPFFGDPLLLHGLRSLLICQHPTISQWSIAWKACSVSLS